MAKSAPKKAAAPAKPVSTRGASSASASKAASAGAAKKASPAKAPAKSTGPAKAAAATKKATAAKAPASSSKAAAPAKATTKTASTKAPAKTAAKTPASTKAAAPAKAPATKTASKATTKAAPAATQARPAPKGPNPFDAKFLEAQRELLLEERAKLLGQADHLDAEAAALMEDLDPGDVQFDDESGEGDTLVVERERDLALAGQARQTVSEIDAALARIKGGSYGFSVISGRPIPKERLRAIPWATELVEEKVGGLGTRR
jgi:RNA polymerase-binding transcription factor DksA